MPDKCGFRHRKGWVCTLSVHEDGVHAEHSFLGVVVHEWTMDEVEPDPGDGCHYCDATAGDKDVTFYFEGVPSHWHDNIVCNKCVKEKRP